MDVDNFKPGELVTAGEDHLGEPARDLGDEGERGAGVGEVVLREVRVDDEDQATAATGLEEAPEEVVLDEPVAETREVMHRPMRFLEHHDVVCEDQLLDSPAGRPSELELAAPTLRAAKEGAAVPRSNAAPRR